MEDAMARRGAKLRRGTPCSFVPSPLKTVCRRLEPNCADGKVTGEYSIRDFESGLFWRQYVEGRNEDGGKSGQQVLIFRGVNVGKIDQSRWYEFSVTLHSPNPNKEEDRRSTKAVFDIIPEKAAKK